PTSAPASSAPFLTDARQHGILTSIGAVVTSRNVITSRQRHMSVSKSPVIADRVSASDDKRLPLVPHFIGGSTVDGTSGRFGDVYNPATGKLARRVAFANKADVNSAVAAAAAAFPQ